MSNLLTLTLVVIPSVAAFAAIWNALALVKYSRINVMNGLQNFMLDKAKDCNNLWNNLNGAEVAFTYTDATSFENFPIPVVSEIIISKQLLDNSLNFLYGIKSHKKKEFLLRQFWTQLDTSLRQAIIMRKNKETYIRQGFEVFDCQFQDIVISFKSMF